MKVILKEKLNKLGNANDVVDVSDGYALNYLIPKKKAIIATQKNVDNLNLLNLKEQQKVQIESEKFLQLKKKIDGYKLIFELDTYGKKKFFHSITSKKIIDNVNKKFNIKLKKNTVILNHKLNKPSEYDIKIKLFTKIFANIVVVVKSKKYESK